MTAVQHRTLVQDVGTETHFSGLTKRQRRHLSRHVQSLLGVYKATKSQDGHYMRMLGLGWEGISPTRAFSNVRFPPYREKHP